MKFSLAETPESNSIQSYDDLGITVSIIQSPSEQANEPERFERSVFVCATQILLKFPISKIQDLSVGNCQPIFELNEALSLDVLLIGSNEQALLPSKLQHTFIEHTIGVECMSIGAACRTYNMLLNESRSVGVLFLI